jgi:hypothetical protein
MTTRGNGLYWTLWLLATASTGLVAGFFLGHALLLGRFLDWLLVSGGPNALASTYPVFRQGPGRTGLDVFYAVAGLQVLAGVAFAVVSVRARRRARLGLIAGLAGIAWPIAHYASGFAAIEARVLRSATAAPPDVVIAFLALNGPVHVFHVGALLVALIALLLVPLGTVSEPFSGAPVP